MLLAVRVSVDYGLKRILNEVSFEEYLSAITIAPSLPSPGTPGEGQG